MNTNKHWKLGLTLSLITATMWGFLPFAVLPLIEVIDPITITFFRLSGGGVLIFLWLVYKGHKIPNLYPSHSVVLLTVIAVLALAANYLLWLYGLELTSPATSQVIIQIAPMLLLLGSVFIFGESFSIKQFLGVVIFLFGFGLFFNQKLLTLFNDLAGYNLGVLYVFLAALVWAVYALIQKQLLKHFQPLHLITILTLAAAMLYLPFASPSKILSLSTLHLFLLSFGMLNTAVAYGCFIEAMRYWETPRVSAVVAIVPVLSLIIGTILLTFAPDFVPAEDLNSLSIIGAIVVVIGSSITALAKNKRS